jgi:pimeloyl-ACP methyl ester carboxylesterase
MKRQIFNKTVNVDGVDIFYREAGDRKNRALLLLHGFPTSSVMFKNLMTALSDKFYLIAPDYPGFGFSAFRQGEL